MEFRNEYRDPSYYQVAVPSYRRPKMLAERTLPFLMDGHVDPERVTVFVHNHDESLPAYREVAARFGVHLHATDERGINAQRAAIRRTYRPGTPLVQLDDDVRSLHEAVSEKRLEQIVRVDAFFETMFEVTRTAGLFSWGLTPVLNPFFMKPGRYSDGLKFVIFSLFGNYVRPSDHPTYINTVPTKDDYEFSLRSWWYDGGILRNEHVAAKADIYKAPGGCQDTRTVQMAADSVDSLIRQWPGLVRINTRRKSEFVEILLNRRPRQDPKPIGEPVPGDVSA